MTTMAKAADVAAARIGRQEVLRGLYWQEWFAHGSELVLIFSGWLIAQWVLLIFFHPLWILILGTLLAVWLGAGFSGADAHEGAEEFTLALPATRAQRYWVRLSVSLPCLVLVVGVSLLAIAFNWPQAVWGLLVDTGFTEAFPREPERNLSPMFYYLLAMACPLAAYGVSFGLASVASTRDHVMQAGLLGLVYTLAGFAVGLMLEEWLWRYREHNETGIVSSLILLGLAMIYLLAGYVGYQRKDGITRPRDAEPGMADGGMAGAGVSAGAGPGAGAAEDIG